MALETNASPSVTLLYTMTARRAKEKKRAVKGSSKATLIELLSSRKNEQCAIDALNLSTLHRVKTSRLF